MTIPELLKQVEENKKHERHLNYRETSYWCQQWRLLACELADAIRAASTESDLDHSGTN